MSATGPARGIETYLRCYRCTVLAEGPVAGQLESAVRFTLADLHVVSSKLAVRWLRYQALRIADGLDPDPAEWPERTVAPVTGVTGDVPTELRAWAADHDAQEVARLELATSGRTRLSVHDAAGRYWLAAQRVPDVPKSVTQPAPASTNAHPPSRRRHARRGRPLRVAVGCAP